MKTLHIDSALTRGSLNVSLLARLVSVIVRIPAGFRSQSHPPATSWKFLSGLFLLCALWLPGSAAAAGTWAPLAHPPPGPAGHFLLLSDGTVMAENLRTNYGPGWFRLAPDSHGSYVNGTWSNTAAMHYTRLDFASIVLKDGRVFVAGGEYGSGTNNAEVYDPVANTWTMVGAPPAGQADFYDSGAVLLANGNVLIAPVYPATYGGTVIFNPSANTLTAGPTLVRGSDQDEATWVKLPDDSILTIDTSTTNSERYIPSSNTWINDANVPDALYDPYGTELGGGMLLPNGNAIFFGSTGNTAIYTPSGNTSPGFWVAGPVFPNGQGQPDAPVAMEVNGKVLCVTCPMPTSGNHFPSPDSFYEYDYIANVFTQVNSPTGGTTFADASWPTLLCDLPDGTILFGHRSTDFYVYQPSGSPIAAGTPTISTVTTNVNGSVHLTGTLFNGLCQGASYGDDEQMDSNFPLVRVTDGSGTVRYGRTYNWSSDSVMTGNAVVSTDCTLPAGASLQDLIQVVANGIASVGTGSVVINTNDNGAGTLRQIVASVPPGTTVTFSTNLSGKNIVLTNGEIALNNNVTIDGSALASQIRLNGNHNSRIFNVGGGANVTLNSLVLTNAFIGAGNWGGAIANGGILALNNCTLTGNSVDSASNGGGIQNNNQLSLTGCTFYGNSAGFSGAVDNRGILVARNSTFYGNSAVAGNGGAIDNPFSATLSLLNCTFVGNSASSLGGAIDNYLSNINVTNCIIAGNTADDIYNWAGSTNTAGGSNIVQVLDNAGTLFGATTILAVNPLLGPMANNGGPTLTMLPQLGSPAIDAGVTGADPGLTTDQRGPGYPRVAGGVVDIGAVEASIVPYVFKNADSDYGSLRYAAIYSPSNSIITFSNALSGQTILVTNGEIALNNNVTIDGSALASPVRLNGNHNSRIFNIAGGVSVTLNSLLLTNGFSSGGNWGGAILNSGTLAMNNCTLTANSVDSSDNGGAIANFGPLTLNACTFYNNTGGAAGAINHYGATGIAKNCTFYGNTAVSGNGGAIDNVYGATLSLLHCTFSGNSSFGVGGGIDNYLSQLNFTNTIIAGNTGNYDIYNWSGSTNGSGGSNIVQVLVNSGILFGANTIFAANPLLGPLANNGGPTLTLSPQVGSPAVDAGVTSADGGLTTDQRGPGYPRLVGERVDIGAVELQLITANTPTHIASAKKLDNGSLQLNFTNQSGASFRVLTATDVSLPLAAWTEIGFAIETPASSGQFQFTDPQATNYSKGFYRVKSP